MAIESSIEYIRSLMVRICEKSGADGEDANVIVDNYLEAEILGKRTHGVGKFIFESSFFANRQDAPEIVLDTGPLVKINGHREIGPVAASRAVAIATERAGKFGVSVVGMDNIQRYGMLRTWAKEFADRGVLVLS